MTAHVTWTTSMKNASLTAKIVVQIQLLLEMAIATQKTTSNTVTLMVEIAAFMQMWLMEFATKKTWTRCADMMEETVAIIKRLKMVSVILVIWIIGATLMMNGRIALVIMIIWPEMDTVMWPTTKRIVSLTTLIVYVLILHWLMDYTLTAKVWFLSLFSRHIIWFNLAISSTIYSFPTSEVASHPFWLCKNQAILQRRQLLSC